MKVRFLAPLHSTEKVFVVLTVTHLQQNNIIFSAEFSLFLTLLMHERKQCTGSTNTKLLSMQCDTLTGFCMQSSVI